MASNNSFTASSYMRKSEQYCAAALVLLTLAIVFLSIIVFTFSPLSVAGIIATCIGVILVFGCIVCFALYNYYLKKAEATV